MNIQTKATNSAQRRAIFQRAQIRDRMKDGLSASAIAKDLNLSYNHVRQIYKQECDQPTEGTQQ